MKQKVPQLNKYGVSQDYRNEFQGVFTSAQRLKSKSNDVFDKLCSSPLRMYEERYSSEQFENVITEENKERIQKINNLASRINELLSKKNRDADLYLSLCNQINKEICEEDLI